MADSILNRIATGARYIDLEGPNMREYFAKKGALISGTETAYSRYRLLLIAGTKPGDRWYRERLLLTMESILFAAAVVATIAGFVLRSGGR